jgi:hypothetical protein
VEKDDYSIVKSKNELMVTLGLVYTWKNLKFAFPKGHDYLYLHGS